MCLQGVNGKLAQTEINLFSGQNSVIFACGLGNTTPHALREGAALIHQFRQRAVL